MLPFACFGATSPPEPILTLASSRSWRKCPRRRSRITVLIVDDQEHVRAPDRAQLAVIAYQAGLVT